MGAFRNLCQGRGQCYAHILVLVLSYPLLQVKAENVPGPSYGADADVAMEDDDEEDDDDDDMEEIS